MRETRSLLAPLASAALAVAVAALAAGCGGGTSDSGASSSATSSAVEPTAVTSTKVHPPTPSTPGPTAPSGSRSASKPPLTTGGKATLTGTAVRGAEPGCVGLDASDGHSYELAGGAPKQLARGGGGYQAKLGKVKVTGHFASAGMASHCMMGRIFVVSKLTKLG